LALALFLFPAGLSAQGTTITGTVRAQSQAPVRGAYVALPGLGVATVANDAGLYQLRVPADKARGQQEKLIVNQIGYRPYETTVTIGAGAQRLDITLQEEAVVLDEVVVTGTVGRQERKAQSAVVASVDAARTAQVAPVTNVTNLLQSRVTGVSVQQASGSAGTAQTIRIRGAASISLSNEPLVFIDGIRADSRNRQIAGTGGQSGTRLNDLRPEEIESIEVVKGPAAATLYGADASAGVIQIITKKGRANGGFSQSIGIEYNRVDNLWDVPDNWGACSKSDIANAKRRLCYGQAEGTIVHDNPMKRYEVFRPGEFRSLSWSGRGGGENYDFFISVGGDNELGTLPGNEYGRNTGRFNFNFIPSNKLRLEAGLGILRVKTDLPQNDNNIYGFLSVAMPGRPNTVGDAADGWEVANRTLESAAGITASDVSLRMQPRAVVNYTPFNWFTHRLLVGGDFTRTEARSMYAKNNKGWYGTAELNSGRVSEAREHRDQITAEYLGNITRHLSDELSADFSFGGQLLMTRTDLTSATGTGLLTNLARSVSAAATRTGTQNYSENRQAGFFGQLHLSWRERLFLQTGARLDKHSSFGTDAKAFLSPKIGLSYVLSEESFWRNSMPEFIGSFRLRGAYGTTGRAPSSGALMTYDAAPFARAAATGAGVIEYDKGNRELRPERGTEAELGFDASLLNERLGLEVSYFRKTSSDLILDRPLAPSEGFSQNQLVNIGGVLNSGFEVAANMNLVTLPSFAWTARAAFNTLHNEITDMGSVAPFGTMNRRTEGRQIAAFYGYNFRRFEKDSNGVMRAIVSDSIEFVGNFLPTFEGSLSSTVTILGNIQVYAQLDRKSDFYIYNNTRQWRDRQSQNSEEYVRRSEILTEEQRARRWGPFFTESGAEVGFNSVSTEYLEPGDFTRLREVSVTYTLPRELAGHFRASGASFTVGARNLALWTKYSGPDPEINSSTGSFSRSDFLTVPSPRRWVARFNVQF
jgi:TonB-linked SusC/RagA family outer membrane protein